jgi:hypothetical protein
MIGDIPDGPERERVLEALRRDTCPDCGAVGFRDGPRGGAGLNIFCRHCGAGFNVALPRQIMFVQRIGSGVKQE